MSATTNKFRLRSRRPTRCETRLGTLEFDDGAPTPETAELLYDHLDFMRGVEAYLNSIPGASLDAIRRGFLSVGVEDNEFLIFPELMDSASLFLTANSDTVYFWTFIDLADGPMVIDVPAMPAPSAILGTIDDMWFRWVTDVGLPGPDRGEGGRYLLVGPGYDGPLPDSGFHVSHVRTTRATLIGRAFMIDNDPAPAVAAVKAGVPDLPLHARRARAPRSRSFLAGRQPLAGAAGSRRDEVRRRRAPGDQHDHAERLLLLGGDRRGRAARSRPAPAIPRSWASSPRSGSARASRSRPTSGCARSSRRRSRSATPPPAR